jgi:hypothetical protein
VDIPGVVTAAVLVRHLSTHRVAMAGSIELGFTGNLDQAGYGAVEIYVNLGY